LLFLIQPIWMFALAGIAVPIVIHLWNIRKGKTLKVGSIALLKEYSRQHSSSLRLTDLLLLVLRCIFIALLAVLISKPVWQKKAEDATKKGWVLIEPNAIKEIYPKFKITIDSLLQKGFEFHYFAPGFARQDLQVSVKDNKDTVTCKRFSYWWLLQALAQNVPDNLSIHLFTGNNLSRFDGSRPASSLNLSWHTCTAKDSIYNTTAAAYLTPADSIRIIKYESTPLANKYSYRTIAAKEQRDNEYQVHIEAGKLLLSGNTGKNSVEVDTTELGVTIYTDNFINDAYYLKAALEAIQQYSLRRMTINLVRNIQDIPARQHWLFWLSAQSIDKSPPAENIFCYQPGTMVQRRSTLLTHKLNTIDEPVSLDKYIEGAAGKILPGKIWQNGFGEPVLVHDTAAKKNVYHFYSHFDPDWNGLVWSEEFPGMLLELVYASKTTPGSDRFADKRIIDTKQLIPVKASEKNDQTIIYPEQTDLSMIIWVAAFIVFFVERVLSFKKNRKVYG
jgi:hypothetical protein